MPKNENQKLKLLRILQILISRTDEEKGITMPALIAALDEYGISAERKSVYDDFRALGEVGFEVEMLPKRPPEYTLAERPFESVELKMLVDAVESSKFITAEQSRRLIEKLSAFAGGATSRKLSRQVYVDDRVKTVNKASIYGIDCIHEAINEKKRISFVYFDYGIDKEKHLRHGGKRYEVAPKALVLNDENYYLSAYDEGDGIMKNFRVDKMLSVEMSDLSPSPESEKMRFNPAEYSKKVFGMYGGKETLVTLEFRERLAGAVIDRFGTEPTFTKTDFGARVSVRVMVSPTFFSWVFSFGTDMRIVAPDAVAWEYKKRLTEALEKL